MPRLSSPRDYERNSMAVTVRTLENFIGGEWVASTSGRYTMLDMTDLKTVVLDVGGID